MVLAQTVQFAVRPDGWIHLDVGDLDVLQGPVGVVLYLAFVPAIWFLNRRYRAAYLSVTSLLLAVACVGPAYTVTLAALAVLGLVIVRTCAASRLYWPGAALLVGSYAALLLHPQPYWLPPIREPVYFYVHWAGIGYLFLKTLHVYIERGRGKLESPATDDWLAYLLFAPSLRMGPIYRYRDFTGQLHGNLAANRSLPTAGLRILTGLVRLGVTGVLLDKFQIELLFTDPAALPTARFLAAIYVAPLAFFLWMSGYMDLSVGVGRAMGFVVPENFNYPWRAVNIGEFWQRWHITLGDWLKDYIFTPMIRRRWHFFWAFTITFLLCGLWHGNAWCYIIWGTAQGVGLAVLRVWSQYWKRQEQRNTPLYSRLRRLRLIDSPVSTVLAWLLTFHYEVVTIMIGMDFDHAGARVGRHLLALMGV